MTFSDLVQRFLEWCAPPRRAVSTVKTYHCRLKPVLAQIGSKSLKTLTPLDIQTALYNANRGLAPDTQRVRITVCETLQRWAVKYELLDRVILDGLEKPKGRKRERIDDGSLNKDGYEDAAGEPGSDRLKGEEHPVNRGLRSGVRGVTRNRPSTLQ